MAAITCVRMGGGDKWINQFFCPVSALETASWDEARNLKRLIHLTAVANPIQTINRDF